MLLNQGTQKPIKVLENNTHFLVEISASQKERASRIAGRRWDAQLVAWIYPKTIECYEALKAEFQRDAAEFDIRKPKRKPLPEAVKTSVDSQDDHDFESEWKEMSEKTSNIDSSFSEVSSKVDYLVKMVQGLEESSDSLERMIIAERMESVIEKDQASSDDDSIKEVLSEKLEELLINIAYDVSGCDPSFKKHMEKLRPLGRSESFVIQTHERLLRSLKAISGVRPPEGTRFIDYVYYVKNNDLIPSTREKNEIGILLTLNGIRNQIAHPDNMSEYEIVSRAISYLMMLALIWREVASEQVDD